jgi:anaerobic ribonucleoside-triphosphate reductase activating protein
MSGPALRIGRMMAPVQSLGPGRRLVLWLQGCTLACPGCVSPDLWDAAGGASWPVEELVRLFHSIEEPLDGLTISGGEPFQQYEALMILAAAVKQRLPWTILVYTGYTVEELALRHPDGAYLHLLDMVIDGRFVSAEQADDGWRGSTNQRMFRSESGALTKVPEGYVPGPWAIDADASAVRLAGIPRKGDLQAIAAHDGVRESGLRSTMARGGTQ